MRPIQTPESDTIYRLPGGDTENDLPAQHLHEEGAVKTVWQPTPEERALLAGGGQVALVIFGSLVPPVTVVVQRPYCPGCDREKQWDATRQRYACTCGHVNGSGPH